MHCLIHCCSLKDSGNKETALCQPVLQIGAARALLHGQLHDLQDTAGQTKFIVEVIDIYKQLRNCGVEVLIA